jgi:hypothetical protein
MTKTKIAVLSLFAALALTVSASAQTVLTMTTLSAALPGSVSSVSGSGAPGVLTVASNSGISAPAPNTSFIQGAATSGAQTLLFVDRELMEVRAVSGTSINVVRGVGSTANTSHASGALVFVVPTAGNTWMSAQLGGQPQSIPAGSCTRSNELYLPRINFQSGIFSDCLGGQWVNGDAAQSTRALTPFLVPPIGGTLQTAIDTAGNAAGATTEEYCTQVYLPYSKYTTGLAVLNGTTVGTNKWLYILRDASGNVLQNTATAGTTTSGASTYQQVAFVTPYYAVGPAVYFACLQANGTTDTYRRVNTAGNQGLFAGKITGGTFGTIVNPITPPSSFTTALGGYWEFY